MRLLIAQLLWLPQLGTEQSPVQVCGAVPAMWCPSLTRLIPSAQGVTAIEPFPLEAATHTWGVSITQSGGEGKGPCCGCQALSRTPFPLRLALQRQYSSGK